MQRLDDEEKLLIKSPADNVGGSLKTNTTYRFLTESGLYEEDRKMIDKETQYRFGIELGQRGGWIINESGLYSGLLEQDVATTLGLGVM